jgi:hypothetical protein
MHAMVYETIQIAIVLGFMAYLAWLWSRRAQQQSELHRLYLEGRNRLLGQIDSPQGLLDFAKTEVGHTLFDPPRFSKVQEPQPKREGLWLVQTGLVSLFMGIGFRSTYHIAMNWRAANVHLNEVDAFRKGVSLWQWSQICQWTGVALILCGLLAALLAYLGRMQGPKA